jgi:hypothetical protein
MPTARPDFRMGIPVRMNSMEHRVLLIEDDPAVAKVIQEALAGASSGPFQAPAHSLSNGSDNSPTVSNAIQRKD